MNRAMDPRNGFDQNGVFNAQIASRARAPHERQELAKRNLRILFVQNRVLFPANSGGRIRTLNILRHLAKWHEVTYLCNVESGDSAYFEQMKAIGLHLETVGWKGSRRGEFRFYYDFAKHLASPTPFSVAKDNNPLLATRAKELLNDNHFDLLICDFVQMAPAVVEVDSLPRILFQHNVEAQIYKRHAKSDRGWLRKLVMRAEWSKMRHFEAHAGSRFDTVIAISEHDRKVFQRDYAWKNVRVIDTAVDTEYFRPDAVEPKDGPIVFVASLDWLPNQDGARYFVEHVWPAILREHPRACFRIIGRNPSQSVRRLQEATNVEVVGSVPDVRPFLAQSSVVVVPLLVGGGTRIKIFEAMAMGKPVVSTSLGAEGLKVVSGKHLVIADTAEHFANAVIELLRSPDDRQRIARCARQLVCEEFSAETVARQFDSICIETAAQCVG